MSRFVVFYASAEDDAGDSLAMLFIEATDGQEAEARFAELFDLELTHYSIYQIDSMISVLQGKLSESAEEFSADYNRMLEDERTHEDDEDDDDEYDEYDDDEDDDEETDAL